MGRLLTFIFCCLLTGCASEHYAEDDFATEIIASEAQKLLSRHNVSGRLQAGELTPVIRNLNPEAVMVDQKGVFIRLNSFMASESGLFVPATGVTVSTEPGQDPGYKLLGHSVFSYVIRG